MLEPYSVSYNILVKNIKLNNLTQVAKTFNVAASNEAGKGRITVNKVNTGAGMILPTAVG